MASIGAKIILPYLLLTLIVAGLGAFIVIRLVTDSLKERFNNQLLDAGRIVSESMVEWEKKRLEVLRAVAGTDGVPEALATQDRIGLAERVPQIIANSSVDAVELVDLQGREIYGWQRPPQQPGNTGEERTGADYTHLPEVQRVLEGYIDEFGEKRVLLSQTPYGLMIFTLGPVYLDSERVGAVMVGTYLSEMVQALTETAVARVTLYNPQGEILETSLGSGQEGTAQILEEPSGRYRMIQILLRESVNQYPVVTTRADNEVPLRRVQILGQEYSLAYGDWRLRGQSIGFFSVALPNNFIVSTAATSRNWLAFLFSIATICVFGIGFITAQRIIQPLKRLVQTSMAVAQGDLGQRTGIRRNDEIGSLADSFDTMTEHLAERNRQLVEQASKLETILNSTADGVVVLDQQGSIITANPAARRILVDASGDFLTDILGELPNLSYPNNSDNPAANGLPRPERQRPQRYKVGNQVFSALVAPMQTPDGETLGTVIALRDVTREAESEQLKDSFITAISHELRTPLTGVKGYSSLLMKMKDSLSEQQLRCAETIQRNANKLEDHINKVIEISEIQDGTLKLNKESFCFTDLVKQVAEQWRRPMADKGLALQVELPESYPYIYGDPARLRWAVDNLLSNAYNYTLAGGQIQVSLFQETARIRLDVSDSGIGIAAADQAYLFTRFFRATHQATYDVGGVGLGLFIRRSIVEMHHGQIWAKSQLDVGSTFSLTLPRI